MFTQFRAGTPQLLAAVSDLFETSALTRHEATELSQCIWIFTDPVPNLGHSTSGYDFPAISAISGQIS
jgi:hypothetical protein